MKKIMRYQGSLIFVILCLLTELLQAQYFGRNKVQYEDFNFKVLETKNFKIYHYPQEQKAIYDAAFILERWNERYEKIFGFSLKPHQPIIIYANHADFQQTSVIGGIIPQGTGGVTEGMKNRIVLPFTGIYSENSHVLGHELVHAFQYSFMKSQEGGLRAARRMPLWFVEGMAEYLTIGRFSPLTAMWMRDAVLNEDVPTIEEIATNRKYFPYRYGHAVWAYITARYGDRMVPALLNSMVKNGWNKTVESVFNISGDSLSTNWRNAIIDTYQPQLKGRTKPTDAGKRIIADETGMNMAPVISPDGHYVAYLARHDIFTLDLYLANARTGEVIKKLVSSNTDSHFDALRFMNSAGTWSPDGKQFAFVVFKNGDNQIAIVDVESQDIIRNINLDAVDAITDLSWSPNGNSIVLSGTIGGISNLYLYDLNNNDLRQLTDDRYAEFQPSWSPDGNIIAFVTDRGPDTDFDKLVFGNMKIGLYNLDNKSVELLSIKDESKHINPHFSPDGKSIFFIADPDGFSDIYRYSFDTKNVYRITKIATGVSGLTENSPAMSMATRSRRIVFSVFDETNYFIHGLEPEDTEGSLYHPQTKQIEPHVALPVVEAADEGKVYNLLNRWGIGLPNESNFSLYNYDPSIQLTYVGQTSIGVGVDRFGSYLGGGVSFLFSDMLNYHMIGVVAQANGGIKDIGGQVQYMNQKNRLRWGAALGHIPYQTGRILTGVEEVTIEGETYLANSRELIRQRVFVDRLSLLSDYPLSTNRRIEASLGYTRISYSFESEKILTVGGIVVDRQETDLDEPSALNLFQSSLAYVGDYSFTGFTSPVRGSRYRLEVEPTFGTLRYLTAIADYRHYFFLNPLTMAFRAFHVGRYLKDAESLRGSSLFLGYETFVRGYSLRSISVAEGSQNARSEEWPEFDRLVGSRIGVLNAEFRLPLFGTEQFGLINFRYLPTELVAFYDAGVAWTKSEMPELIFERDSDKRIPVMSTGLAARFNILGYLVAQVYYAYPFQRPDKGAHFGFVIAPGW